MASLLCAPSTSFTTANLWQSEVGARSSSVQSAQLQYSRALPNARRSVESWLSCSSGIKVTSSRLSTLSSYSSSISGCKLPAWQSRPARSSSQQGRGTGLIVRAAKNSDAPEAAQRLLAALGYFLPLFDGVKYGRFLFQRFPITQLLIEPFAPALQAYQSFQYAPIIAFFVLYLAVVQNASYNRYVRFNVMQAIILDVLLILPSLAERVFTPKGGIGLEIFIMFYNTVFVYLFVCFVFGVVSCILGKTPRLPLVADAADAQIPM